MNEAFTFQGYSMSNQLLCYIDGEDIYQVDYMGGNKRLIGKTSAAYKDLEDTTTEYYNKLVELGVIQKPQDPQEMMQEMQRSMLEMSGIIKSLSDEVRELKKNGRERNSISGGENVSERGRKRGSTEGTAGNTGNAG